MHTGFNKLIARAHKAQALMGGSMDKYAYEQDDSKTKTAAEKNGKCPKCGSELKGNPPVCPKCGSEPFEKRQEGR